MAEMKLATFHCFPNLPPELRQQIWASALFEYIEPAVFMYKEGLWEELSCGDSEDVYHFRDDLLDPVHLKLSLACVNQEARRTTLNWIDRKIKEPNVKLVISGTRQLFAYSFVSNRDILFVPEDFWTTFIKDPKRILHMDGIKERFVHRWPTKIQRLALPVEALLPDDVILDLWLLTAVGILQEHYPALEELIIVFGQPPTTNYTDNDPNVQEGWELVETGFEDNKVIQYFKSWLIEKACWLKDDNVLKHATIRGAHAVRKFPKKIGGV